MSEKSRITRVLNKRDMFSTDLSNQGHFWGELLFWWCAMTCHAAVAVSHGGYQPRTPAHHTHTHTCTELDDKTMITLKLT